MKDIQYWKFYYETSTYRSLDLIQHTKKVRSYILAPKVHHSIDGEIINMINESFKNKKIPKMFKEIL